MFSFVLKLSKLLDEILDRIDKAIIYVRKLNEKLEESKEDIAERKRVTIEMVSMILNDLIEIRNSLNKLFDKYIELSKKIKK